MNIRKADTSIKAGAEQGEGEKLTQEKVGNPITVKSNFIITESDVFFVGFTLTH